MANFAPYQDVPETSRALSPPLLTSPRASHDYDRSHHGNGNGNGSGNNNSNNSSNNSSNNNTRNIGTAAAAASYQQRDFLSRHGGDEEEEQRVAWNAPGGFGGAREDVDMFETRLGLRMDYEACLAYLALPPAGPVLLLMLEHRSDYVRFHAWQSSLLFSFLFVVHIIFSWSAIISWFLLVIDLGLIGYLTMRAYQDAEMLDRFEVPFFGALANSILDDE